MAIAPKMMTGARARLEIKGTPVAFATSVGYRVAIPHASISVLGRYSVARHEPLGYDVTVNCGVLRFVDVNGGNDPTGGGNGVQGEKLMPPLQEILTSEELDIVIYDRKKPEGATEEPTLIRVRRCRLTDRGGSLNSRDLLSENWTFVGIVADQGETGEEAASEGALNPNVVAAE